SSGREAIEKIGEWEPDLVLMDIAMPGMNGIQAAEVIKARPSPPRVILYSFNDTPEYRTASRDVGADGFVSKTEFWNDLMPHIHGLFTDATLPRVACAA
ncbi:MAG: response regulator transcription factor, partial [Verrucomicrobia bacterium]|nr:response regulator transcription factor [Verrucomicrobiota bacterium]